MSDEKPSRQTPDYRQQVLAAAADLLALVRLTFSQAAGQSPWERVVLRPVELRGQRCVQAAYYAGKRHITKNFGGDELPAAIDELLALPFSQIHAQSTTGDLHVRITRKGKALVARGKPSTQAAQPPLAHDHQKSYLLAADRPDALLEGLGIMTAEGKVRAGMFPKFRQINEFLRVIEQVVGRNAEASVADNVAEVSPTGPASVSPTLNLVDCGCGSAYLTFGAFHYLRHVRGLAVRGVGMDSNADLIAKCLALRDRLGWAELDFKACRIADFVPPEAPDLVVSLHACDTATDEALALGVKWASRAILAAPCCQHELHDQIQSPDFASVLRHGLLRERLADILTDAFRSAALRVMSYKTRVFEFISPLDTAKNLMIVAEKISGHDGDLRPAAQEYLRLRQFWNVTPFIEKALGEEFQRRLAIGG